MTTSYDRITATTEDMRLYQQERAIEAVSSLIIRTMKKAGVNRAALAERLGVSPGWVTQLLDGERNKTIRSISDVFSAIGYKLEFESEPIAAAEEKISCVRIRGRAPAPSADRSNNDTADSQRSSGRSTLLPFCVA